MPRKKKIETTTDEPISVLQPEIEEQTEDAIALGGASPIAIEELVEPVVEPELNIDPESCPRDYLAASLQATTESIGQLFEKQAELQGTQVADAIFDRFESAFISRLEQRLQPFVDVVLPQVQDASIQLKARTTARTERRLSAFQRLQQIASKVTDDCRLMLPGGEVSVVGEFVHWEPINEDKENA